VTLNPYIFFLVLSTSLLASNGSARDLYHANESSLQVSRYVNLLPGPTNAQRNPLHMVLPNVSFRAEVKSVGQALRFLLKDTGFRLARYHPDKRVFQMFRLSLPKIHRHMGPLTLEQALNTLSGEPWILSIDPINRLVSFQLPDYVEKAFQTHSKALPRPPSKKTVVIPKKATWSTAEINQLQQQYQQALKTIYLADLSKATR